MYLIKAPTGSVTAVPDKNIIKRRSMKRLHKTLFSPSTFKAEWPRCLLLGLMLLLFIGNAGGLLQFDNLLPAIDIRTEFLAAAGKYSFVQVLKSGDFLLLLVSGTLLVTLLPMLTPIGASLLVAILAVPPLWLELAAPFRQVTVPMQFHWLVQLILFGANMLMKYFNETQEKQQLLDTFSQFVPPEIVKELNHQSKQNALQGESRYLTVFFCDLRNFTAMSEQLDPREVVQLLNEYFTTMTGILYKYGATIDKYIGDSVMAFWGAPARQEDHYRRAVLASFEMHKQMDSLADIFHALNLPTPTIGIGINSGLVSVGNMGSHYRLAYTVIGDTVNLASRLQSVTRQYHVKTIAGENTVKMFRDNMVFRELDTVAVKGKTQTTRIYEPVCEMARMDEALREKLALHQAALECWYRGDETLALEKFNILAGLYPEDLYYSYMAGRCIQPRSVAEAGIRPQKIPLADV